MKRKIPFLLSILFVFIALFMALFSVAAVEFDFTTEVPNVSVIKTEPSTEKIRYKIDKTNKNELILSWNKEKKVSSYSLEVKNGNNVVLNKKDIKANNFSIYLPNNPKICGYENTYILTAVKNKKTLTVANEKHLVKHDWNEKGPECLQCGLKDEVDYYFDARMVPALYKQDEPFQSTLTIKIKYKQHEKAFQLESTKEKVKSAFKNPSTSKAGTFTYRLEQYKDNDNKPLLVSYTVFGTPTKLKASGEKTNAFTLSWNKVEGADQYFVYQVVKNNDRLKLATVPAKKVKGNTVKTIIKGLTPATAYKICVTAYKNQEKFESAYSETKTVITKLTTPSEIQSIRKKDELKLQWKPSNGAKKYWVYQYDSKNKKYLKPITVEKPEITFKSLNSTKEYRFKIIAVKGSLKSDEVVFNTSLKVNYKDSKAHLSWARYDKAEGYCVKYTKGSFDSKPIEEDVLSSDKLKKEFDLKKEKATYYFIVEAIDGDTLYTSQAVSLTIK